MMNRIRLALAALAMLGVAWGPVRAQQASRSAWAQDAQEQEDEARKQAEEARKQAEQAKKQTDAVKQQKAEAKAQAKKLKEKYAELEWGEGGEEFTDQIAKVFSAGQRPSIVLSNIAGEITVSASSGSEIKLEATKRVRAKSESEGKRLLDATRIDVNDHSGRIEVQTIYGESKHRVAVDYVVTAPAATMLDIRSVAGDVIVDGIKGEVRAETVSGNVTATGLAKECSLKAVSGDVTVSSAAIDGDLNASSVSGDLLVKGYKARAVNVGTVSGDVRLHYGVSERLLARSVNGDLEYSGSLVKGGVYEVKSHSGNIKLLLDGKSGFEIDASSFSGEIKTDLPLTVQSSSGDERYGHSHRSMHAVFGDGSARIEAATFSGNVVIGGKK
jgi:DUF4097 and DUF4098 domain-containing protein YvlB